MASNDANGTPCPDCGPLHVLDGQYMSDASEAAGEYDGYLCGHCRGYWTVSDLEYLEQEETPAALIARAIVLLREARELLKRAGAARTVSRVRLALTSAGGAARHAQGRDVSLWLAQQKDGE